MQSNAVVNASRPLPLQYDINQFNYSGNTKTYIKLFPVKALLCWTIILPPTKLSVPLDPEGVPFIQCQRLTDNNGWPRAHVKAEVRTTVVHSKGQVVSSSITTKLSIVEEKACTQVAGACLQACLYH